MEAEEVFRREVVERHVLLALPRPALVKPEAVFAGEVGALTADSRTGCAEAFITPSSTAAAATSPGPAGDVAGPGLLQSTGPVLGS